MTRPAPHVPTLKKEYSRPCPMSSFWVAPGWCTEYMHAYLATDLRPASLASDEDEFISVVPVPLPRIPELIQSGEIQDAKSIASLLLALRVLDES